MQEIDYLKMVGKTVDDAFKEATQDYHGKCEFVSCDLCGQFVYNENLHLEFEVKFNYKNELCSERVSYPIPYSSPDEVFSL